MSQDLPSLQRRWHDKVAELQRIGAAIALAKNDPWADPFEQMKAYFFEQERAAAATYESFKSNFIKPLP